MKEYLHSVYFKNKASIHGLIGVLLISSILSILNTQIQWANTLSNILFVITSVHITYVVLKRILDKDVFDSRIFIAIISISTYTLLLSCTILVAWVIDRNFPLTQIPYFTLLFITLSAIYTLFTNSKLTSIQKQLPPKKLVLIQSSDIVAITIATLITGITLITPFIRTDFAQKSTIIAQINYSTDDAAHLSLVNDRLLNNRGVFYHSDATANMLTAGSQSYPISWHAANAVIIKVINPDISIGQDSMIAYIASKLFWYTILLFIFVKSFFVIGKLFLPSKIHTLLLATSIAAFSAIFSFFIVDIYIYGFYNFFPQLIAVMILSLILIQFGRTGITKGLLAFAGLVTISGSLVWLLSLPSLLIGLIGSIILCLYTSKTNAKVEKIVLEIIYVLPIYLLLACATMVQLLTTVSDEKISFIQAISLDGGVSIYNIWFYIFIFSGVILFTLFAPKNLSLSTKNQLILISSILIFAMFIYTIQIAYTEKNAYYYYKFLYLYIIAALPFAVVGVMQCIDRVHKNKDLTIAVLVTIFIFAVTFQYTGNSPALAYLAGNRRVPQYMNEAIYNIQNRVGNLSNSYTIFYTVEPLSQNTIDRLSSFILKASRSDSPCFNQTRQVHRSDVDIEKLMTTIKQYCPASTDLNLITSEYTFDIVKNAANNHGLSNRINVKLLQDS